MREEELSFDFGKHEGKTFEKVSRIDMGYIEWIASSSFSARSDTQKKIKSAAISLVETAEYKFMGNLTNRIKTLVRLSAARRVPLLLESGPHITEFKREMRSSFLGCKTTNFIKLINGIYPAGAGVFIDYLMRHIISKLAGIKFYDHRFNEIRYEKGGKFKHAKKILASNESEDAIREIYIASTCHMIFFDQHDKKRSREMRCHIFSMNKDIVTDIRNCVMSEGFHISPQINPILGNTEIPADADLICGSTVVDFKCTQRSPSDEDIYQTCGYAALATRRDIKINEVCIFNPLLNIILKINIGSWSAESRARFLEVIS